MYYVVRIAVAALSLVALAPAQAEEPERPALATTDTARVCLDQKDRRAESEAGRVVPLAAAMRVAKRRMPGTIVRARLCRGQDGLVYVLTVLAHDGKVAQLTVDAAKGTLVGGL